MIEALENRTLFAVGTLAGTAVNLNTSIGPDCADPVRNVAYFVDEGNDKIVAVNTDTGNTAGFASTSANVAGLAVSVDDTRLFASEPGAFQVEVFSLPSMTLLTTLNNGIAIQQIVSLANNRFAGMANGIQIFDGSTGGPLYSLPSDYDGLLRANKAGTVLFSRTRGLSGNDGSIHDWDTSGTGAPVALPNIPGPVGANSTDFAVDATSGYAYMGDGGSAGPEVTLLSNGMQTTWSGGSDDGLATLEGGQVVYAMTFNNSIEQFNHGGVLLNQVSLPLGDSAESLIITPNGNLLYTFTTDVGIVGISNLNISETMPSNQLAFQVQPSSALSGATISPAVVVDVEDPSGELLTSDNSDVTLSLAGGSGTLGGTLTVQAQGGVATFNNLSVAGNGAYLLQATDGSDTPAVSNSFTISLPKLAFVQQPSNGTTGTAISPAISVAIEDQSGSVVTTDNSPVTLSLASGTGTVVGNLTVDAQSGIATFSNITLSQAGTYTLLATDGADTSATSTSFTITTTVTVPPNMSHLVFVQQPSAVASGVAMTPPVTVEFQNQSGTLVSTSASVTLAVASGPGLVGGTVTVPAINGIATFNSLVFATAGSYTLSVTSGGSSGATSIAFTVTPVVGTGTGGSDHLAFIAQPDNVVAGQINPQHVTVELLDQNNNLVTGDSSTISISVGTGPSATVSGTTSVGLVNGVATFADLSINTAGTYTLSATDGTDAPATSSSFAVTPAAATQLGFIAPPSETIAGSAIDPVVVGVEDQFGNVVTIGKRSQVKFSIASGPKGAKIRSSAVSTANGHATASNIELTTAGGYTLKATDGRLSAISNSFTVDPAAAARLQYLKQPANAVAGASISSPVVVELVDRFKNIVTTDDSILTLSINSGPSGASLGGTDSVNTGDGLGTFADLDFSTAGQYRLKASDHGLILISKPIKVTAG